MRKGWLMMGISTCNSNPVDMRGIKLVRATGFKSGEKGGGCIVLGTHPEMLNAGQPNCVVSSVLIALELMRNCDWRAIKSTPVSMNAARATGPTMGTRYSTLVTRLVSPPGKVGCE